MTKYHIIIAVILKIASPEYRKNIIMLQFYPQLSIVTDIGQV